MGQETRSLCSTKTGEILWDKHIVSTNQLQLRKHVKSKIAVTFYEMIFNTCPMKMRNKQFKKSKKNINFLKATFFNKTTELKK